METLLQARPTLDAVFVASDLMAAGALRVLRDRGRRVPDEIAVTAFEDSAIVADNTSPRLTTVRQPVEEMGRRMAELLVARIRGDEVERQVLLETEMVVRDSA
jgi:DNA-binding LacI/PurR family transcriptional regulator